MNTLTGGKMQKFKSRFLAVLLTLSLSSQLISCGYLIHPERRGQKTMTNLDWPIVGLDAIGLIFFIIPGVIAFAIDFTSGTIYLPANGKSFPDSVDAIKKLEGSKKINLEKSELTKEKIAQVIKSNTAIEVDLNSPQMQIYKN